MSRRNLVAAAGVAMLLATSTGCGSLRSEEEISAAASSGAVALADDGGFAGANESSVASDPASGGALSPATTARSANAGGATDPAGAANTGGQGAADATDSTPSANSAGPASGPATGSTITLGHIGTYSGIIGGILQGGDAAIQVWASWVNDNGGLNGHRVEVITADDQGDPARYQQLARDMVENRGVIAFVGNNQPLSASGARNYVEQQGIPLVGGDGASDVWFESPMYFGNTAPYSVLSQGAAAAAVAEGNTRIASAYCGEAPACAEFDAGLAEGAADGGYQIVYRAEVSLAQPDYTAECIQARDRGATAFLLAVESSSISRFARSCSQQGYNPLYLTAGLATTNSLAEDPNVDGLIAPLATFPWVTTDTPAAQIYADALATYAPGLESSGATTGSWASGMLLRAASSNFPEGDVTSEDVLAGLWALRENNLDGLTVPLTYQEGQPASRPQCFFLSRISGGSWVAPQGSQVSCI